MTGLCIFITLLNVLATHEEMTKIYIKANMLCHFNHTFIERTHKNESILLYTIKNSNVYCIKIAIYLDLIKIY